MTALADESSAGVEPDAVDALAGVAPSVSTWEPVDEDEFERRRLARIRAQEAAWEAEQQAAKEAEQQRLEEEAAGRSRRNFIANEVKYARLKAEAQAAIAADRAGSLDLPMIFTLDEFLTAEFTGAK